MGSKKIFSLALFVLITITLCTVNFLYAQYSKATKNKQRAQFAIRDIRVDRVRRSSESGTLSAVQAGRSVSHWYKVTTVYSSQPAWADGVIVKYYVLLEEKGRGSGYTMLVDEVEYDSVPHDNLHYSHVFVHPRTVERYGKPKKVMAEIWSQGIRVSQEWWPKKTDDEWWVQYRPLDGNLKVKFFTPFVMDKNLQEENINIKSLFD